MGGLDAEVAHRGRKILVLQPPSGGPQQAHSIPKWLLGFFWDAIFVVKDMTDLKLAATVIQHTAKPTRVVWIGTEPQAAVLGALGRVEGTTLISILEKVPTSLEWQAIFWTPDAQVETVEPGIFARLGGGRAGQLRSILKELRASDVGLVWSSIGESDKRGDLYWYDPGEGGDLAPALDLGEAAETLRSVAEYLTGRGS